MVTFNDRYPENYFAPSQMPLGDHLDELSKRLRRALAGIVIVMFLGFAIDMIGMSTGYTELGFAFPILRTMTAPAEQEVEAYYLRRCDEIAARLVKQPTSDEKRERFVLGFYDANENRTRVVADVDPIELARLAKLGELRGGLRRPMTALSPQEVMVTYFKVAFVSALVIASPWVFYQLWLFVAAGLYSHEKRYVYTVLPASVTLFLAGVALCQFAVLPSAVRALLAFNEWAGYDPDLRLREWMGFAIALPLVFGASFQAPVVMAFFTRIGLTTTRGYLTYWKHAAFGMAIFAAVITPTSDVITWAYLFVPMFGLYLVGVGVCSLIEPRTAPVAAGV